MIICFGLPSLACISSEVKLGLSFIVWKKEVGVAHPEINKDKQIHTGCTQPTVNRMFLKQIFLEEIPNREYLLPNSFVWD